MQQRIVYGGLDPTSRLLALAGHADADDGAVEPPTVWTPDVIAGYRLLGRIRAANRAAALDTRIAQARAWAAAHHYGGAA